MSIPEILKPTANIGIENIDGLYRYALVLTRSRVDAEDLVQETFVRALEAFDRLRENSNLKAWLFTILRNIWMNHLRKRRGRPQLVEVDADIRLVEGLKAAAPDAQTIVEDQEDAKLVRSVIDKLPSEFQEIIILREFEELSYKEIANLLGCPAGTVMSRLGRARAKLRDLLLEESSVQQQPGRIKQHGRMR